MLFLLFYRIKLVCAVEMTMYFHWTCINVNRKDVHASMISFNGKYINNMGAYHGLKRMKPQLCFFKNSL